MIVPTNITADGMNVIEPAAVLLYGPSEDNPQGVTGGDLFPSQTRPTFVKDLSLPSMIDDEPPLWNDEGLDWGHNLFQYAARQTAAERFGDVPTGKEYYIRIYQDYRVNLTFKPVGLFQCEPNPIGRHFEVTYQGWTELIPTRNACSPPGGGCGLCFNCPDDPETLNETWATDLEFVGSGSPTTNYVCNQGWFIVEKWRDPGDTGDGEDPMAIEDPPTINLPVSFPAPPLIPRAQPPVLHGGVVENVGSEESYVDLVPNEDGSYDINLGIPLTCIDCGQGPQGDPGEQGEQGEQGPQGDPGIGGNVKLIGKVFTRKWMDPSTGNVVDREVPVNVPFDEEDDLDMGTLFGEMFYMLDQILNGEKLPLELELVDSGDIVPFSEEGLG